MKLRIFSCLHFESGFNPLDFTPPDDADLVILAGNIGHTVDGVYWAKYTYRRTPVVYVLGSHEYGGTHYGALLGECKHAARGSTVSVLEREMIDISGVRILGTTLWTSFHCVDERADPETFRGWNELTRRAEAREFEESRQWLDEQLTQADRPLVVVTHHAPSAATCPPQPHELESDPSARRADDLLRPPVRLWVHGHTHVNVDTRVNGVRVITNQRGALGEPASGFRSDGSFEVDL